MRHDAQQAHVTNGAHFVKVRFCCKFQECRCTSEQKKRYIPRHKVFYSLQRHVRGFHTFSPQSYVDTDSRNMWPGRISGAVSRQFNQVSITANLNLGGKETYMFGGSQCFCDLAYDHFSSFRILGQMPRRQGRKYSFDMCDELRRLHKCIDRKEAWHLNKWLQ